jgi:predicted N-acyltransferase
MPLEIEAVGSLDEVDPAAWDALAGSEPFMRHAFLRLLQSTGCASPRTGWQPHYLLVKDGDQLKGACTAYLKRHSRGEFVFDHAWAEAYQRHGLAYYPKMVVAAPFTPVTGPRLLANDDEAKALLARALVALARQTEVSSVHVLFPDDTDRRVLQDVGYLVREGVQFHWRNHGFESFEGFLATMSHDKRKKLKQDRKKVDAAGIGFRWLEGDDIGERELAFFQRCQEDTYARHWGQGRPYLSQDFFRQWHAAEPGRLLLVLAERDAQPVACALNVKGDGVLYGRYWGATEFVPGLHFEACYAQAIAWCIANGFHTFEGGAQGEHKMARGLEPVRTFSAHWIADERFAAAVSDFLQQEALAIGDYVEGLAASSPFKATSA